MTHDRLSPSRLTYLEQCLDFEGGEKSEAADFGTKMHSIIHMMAAGGKFIADSDEYFMASRSLEWLHGISPSGWQHEVRIEGAIEETGGTMDVALVDTDSRKAIIVDWKASLPVPNAAQGKAYALNLWTHIGLDKLDSVTVHFYNYRDGSFVSAEYYSPITLRSDIEALIRRHGSQMGSRRSANPGCSYCRHRSSCQVAMTETTTVLSIEPDTEVMPITDLLSFYDRLKAVMKRAEALESAAKSRLMDAARAGELPGYCVKSKRGNKIEWSNEAEAKTALQRILDDHFAQADLVGLLPPAQVKARLKEVGVSLTREDEGRLAAVQTQNSYEYLAKDKP